MEEQRAPFEMPRIRDLTIGSSAGWTRQRPGPADLVLVSREQLATALESTDHVDEIPATAGARMLFTPYGLGHLGVPFCPSPEPGEVTCWPMQGGTDDNPLAWVCVCDGPREEQRHVGPSTSWRVPTFIIEPCRFSATVDANGALKLGCVKGSCAGRCRLVATRGTAGVFEFACHCVT